MSLELLFHAIASVSQALVAVAVIYGVVIAKGQLKHTREQAAEERRVSIAVEVVDLVHSMQSKILAARMPASFGPVDLDSSKTEFFRNRIENLDGIEDQLSRLRVLKEYVDYRFQVFEVDEIGSSIMTDMSDFDMHCGELLIAFRYLYAYSNSDQETDLAPHPERWSEQFKIAISSEEFGEDVFGHNLRTISRGIINSMSSYVSRPTHLK